MGAVGVAVDVAEPLRLTRGVPVLSFVTDDVDEALTDAELVEVGTTELEAVCVPEVQVDGVSENDLIGEKDERVLWLTCSEMEGLGEWDELGDPDGLRDKDADIEGRLLTEDSAVRDATCTVALADVLGEFEAEIEDETVFEDCSDRDRAAVDDQRLDDDGQPVEDLDPAGDNEIEGDSVDDCEVREVIVFRVDAEGDTDALGDPEALRVEDAVKDSVGVTDEEALMEKKEAVADTEGLVE
jgi:hypothetical protein